MFVSNILIQLISTIWRWDGQVNEYKKEVKGFRYQIAINDIDRGM